MLINTRLKNIITAFTVTLCLSMQCKVAQAADWQYSYSGHSKYQFIYKSYPDDSLFRDLAGANTKDNNLDIRLKGSIDSKHWDANIDYQLIGIYGDSLKAFKSLSQTSLSPATVINDDTRLWDLTYVFEEENKHAVLHRLDRINIGYTGDKTVIRIGRQAVSWGNGLMYSPMDIFNPFDPTSIDKEYKTGDDMLYAQYLNSHGDDIQLVYVARRDITTSNIESKAASLAVKYHAFLANNEYDLLLARHYNDDLLGIGGAGNLGEAVWRGDLIFTLLDDKTATGENDDKSITSVVTSLSYSWILWDTNFSGNIEYFHNGFGEHEHNYDKLLTNTALIERLTRGELYTMGKHYIAAATTIELNPLLLFSPTVFINIEDQSSLAQLLLQYDWLQNLQLLTAISIPSGKDNTEYGGIKSGINNKLLSTGPSLFMQLSWYF